MLDYGVSFVATVMAWDATNNTYKTGDAANIALRWDKDGTDAATTNACAEVSAANRPGEYKITITAAEAQCAVGKLAGKSSSSGIVIIPMTYTFIKYGVPVGASISVDIAAVKTDTGNLITRIPAALFAGITSLAHWLGAIAGKQAANATAQTELRATGAGSGTFDPTTDSVEALRDRGDAAWLTGPTAAAIRAEIDSNSTQLAATITALGLIDDFVDELESRLTALRAGYLDNLSAGAVAQAATALSTATWTGARAAVLDQILADFGAAYQNVSFAQAQKLMLAVLVGPSSGLAGATAHMKKLDNSGDAVSTSIDVDGNRGTPTLTP